MHRAIDSNATENYRRTSITVLNVLPHNAIKSFMGALNGRLWGIILIHLVNTIIAQCIFDKTFINFYNYFQLIISNLIWFSGKWF